MTGLILVVKNLGDNSVGRAYCIWLLARSLGWDCKVVAPAGKMWGPLVDTPFAEDCSLADNLSRDILWRCNAIVSIKPVPGALDLAITLSQQFGKPLIVDIDDPDLEDLLALNSPKRVVRAVLKHRERAHLRDSRALAIRSKSIVSNPILQAEYGGSIIPHVRQPRDVGKAHLTTSPQVAFIGTNRAHKGVPTLRRAVASLANRGYTLLITDDPPPDAQPWETWTGRTSLEEGLNLVDQCDIVAIPSASSAYGDGQLPVKLIDAMFAGRAVVVFDVGPLAWAVGRHGLVVQPTLQGLIGGLSRLSDPTLRRNLGSAARQAAMDRFSISANAPILHSVVFDGGTLTDGGGANPE